MTPEQRATATQLLYMNMTDYWYKVNSAHHDHRSYRQLCKM